MLVSCDTSSIVFNNGTIIKYIPSSIKDIGPYVRGMKYDRVIVGDFTGMECFENEDNIVNLKISMH
jgi:predicted PP-loop superfamily ATPase